MIFLPNNFERYTSALRNTFQLFILKRGIKPKFLKSLMKIHRAEAIFLQNISPLDITDFSRSLLKAVFVKKLEDNKKFRFSVKSTGVFLIEQKLYASLLLTLCQTAEKISVELLNEKILIKAEKTHPNNAIKLIKAIEADYFYEIKTENLIIAIKPSKTDKKPIQTEKDWEYLLNPLSVVNLYIN